MTAEEDGIYQPKQPLTIEYQGALGAAMAAGKDKAIQAQLHKNEEYVKGEARKFEAGLTQALNEANYSDTVNSFSKAIDDLYLTHTNSQRDLPNADDFKNQCEAIKHRLLNGANIANKRKLQNEFDTKIRGLHGKVLAEARKQTDQVLAVNKKTEFQNLVVDVNRAFENTTDPNVAISTEGQKSILEYLQKKDAILSTSNSFGLPVFTPNEQYRLNQLFFSQLFSNIARAKYSTIGTFAEKNDFITKVLKGTANISFMVPYSKDKGDETKITADISMVDFTHREKIAKELKAYLKREKENIKAGFSNKTVEGILNGENVIPNAYNKEYVKCVDQSFLSSESGLDTKNALDAALKPNATQDEIAAAVTKVGAYCKKTQVVPTYIQEVLANALSFDTDNITGYATAAGVATELMENGPSALQTSLTRKEINKRINDGVRFTRQLSVGTSAPKALENIRNSHKKGDEELEERSKEVGRFISNNPNAFTVERAREGFLFWKSNNEPITHDRGQYTRDLKNITKEKYKSGCFDTPQAALAATQKQLSDVYGSSNINTGSTDANGKKDILTKYPPEKYYRSMSAKEMRRVAIDKIKKFPAFEDVKDEEIFFVEDRITEQQARKGEPTYIAYRKKKGEEFSEPIADSDGLMRFGPKEWRSHMVTQAEMEAFEDVRKNQKKNIILANYYQKLYRMKPITLERNMSPSRTAVVTDYHIFPSKEEEFEFERAQALWEQTRTMCSYYLGSEEGKEQYNKIMALKRLGVDYRSLNEDWVSFKENAERYWDETTVRPIDIPHVSKKK